ncbi:MAG: hypothetical protein RLZZ244_873 [Verrucomicrobiota bacterium]
MTFHGVKCSPSWRPPALRSSQGSEHPVPTGLAAWGVAQARCRDRTRRRPLELVKGGVWEGGAPQRPRRDASLRPYLLSWRGCLG